MNLDGEFAIFIYDSAKNRSCFVNDPLGRITYYLYRNNDTTIIAREPKFIAGLVSKIALSPFGLAEAMLFMFPLGSETMFSGVEKIPPATLVVWEGHNSRASAEPYFKWNFSENQLHVDARYYVDELLEPFLKSSRDRLETFRDRKKIMALSGGLDSRTILAGLAKYDSDLTCVTFVDDRGTLLRDLNVAKDLARTYGLETRHIDLPGINIDDMNRLINMKDGHGTGGIMGTVVKSLEILLGDYGHGCAFFTGDGGGLILAPRTPAIKLEDANDLCNQILRRHSLFSLEDASSVTRLRGTSLRARLHDYFNSYPETEIRDKFGHFSIFEHLYRLSFEGEDRVRFFFWCNTPFYSMPFFYKAMQLSDHNKYNHRLFAEFHKRLDPRIARIKYANWGFPITSPLTPVYISAKNWVIDHPAVEKIVRQAIYSRRFLARHGKLKVVDKDVELMRRHVENVIKENPAIDAYLDLSRIKQSLPSWNNLLQLYSITNIMTYLSKLVNSGVELDLGD